jgi:DNA-binding transcriptional MerR regulator
VFDRLVSDSLPVPDAAAGLSISRASAMLGLTAKAIRTYHARGLVPEPPRDDSGYRRYDPATLVRLARVRRLRELGLPLNDIAPLLTGGDGGAALREKLRALEKELVAEAARLRARRTLVAGLLEEGVDDPIAVSAADVWEELSVAWARELLPDLTPEEELSERRFQRAMSALMRPPAELPPLPAPPLDMDPDLKRRLATTQRRFYALADADPDDPRVDALIPEMADALVEAMATTAAMQNLPGGEGDARDGGDLIEPAFATALETVPPAQRRVLQVLMTTILEQLASKDGP